MKLGEKITFVFSVLSELYILIFLIFQSSAIFVKLHVFLGSPLRIFKIKGNYTAFFKLSPNLGGSPLPTEFHRNPWTGSQRFIEFYRNLGGILQISDEIKIYLD